MTPSSMRLTGNILLGIAFVILAVRLADMLGWAPLHGATKGLAFLALAFIIIAGAFRRRGKPTP